MSKLVFRVKNAPDSLPSVDIVSYWDNINPPNGYIYSHDYMTNARGWQVVWDSNGEVDDVYGSYFNLDSSATATTLSSGAEKVIYSSITATLNIPSGQGGGTVTGVKGFVFLSVGSLTDSEVVSILNEETGISGVQASQVMHEGDGWFNWAHPTLHNPNIPDFAVVYLLSSQVS